jgi:hypothetical protein
MNAAVLCVCQAKEHLWQLEGQHRVVHARDAQHERALQAVGGRGIEDVRRARHVLDRGYHGQGRPRVHHRGRYLNMQYLVMQYSDMQYSVMQYSDSM